MPKLWVVLHFQRESSPAYSTLSMREKTLLKRRVNKEHNSNFRAGYVNINEEHLHKTGIRGRKQYIICVIMCIMLVIAILNLLVSILANQNPASSTVCPLKESGHLMEDYSVDTQCFGKISSGYCSDT